MLILKSFKPGWGEPSPSPFCVKAMCLLTLSGLEWRPDFQADVRKSPNKKLPVLLDGDKVIADSDAIEAYLSERKDLSAGLSDAERGQARALIRMVEEHLYFILVRDRWVDERVWPLLRDTYFSEFPFPLRSIVPALVRRDIKGALHGQGIGRMPDSQVLSRAQADLDAIASQLGQTAFLFGDKPAAVDASVGATLNAILAGPIETDLTKQLKARPSLIDYAGRVREALYPDPTLWQSEA